MTAWKCCIRKLLPRVKQPFPLNVGVERPQLWNE